MASKKGEDMTLGQKIMDTATQGWNEAKNFFTGSGHKAEEAEHTAEKLADKASDSWESTKVKASANLEAAKEKATIGAEAIKNKAAETKQSIVKEISPEKKSTVENLQEKAADAWETAKERASKGLEEAQVEAIDASSYVNKKLEEGGAVIKDAVKGVEEKIKNTVTYASETMDESAQKLWKTAHKRDDKLYAGVPDKTTFEKVYEQAYEDAVLNVDAKELLPLERAVLSKETALHNPIKRSEQAKNKEEALQEIAETSSEILAPRVKEGLDKKDLGLGEVKPSNLGLKPSPEKLAEMEKLLGDPAKDSYDKAVDWVNERTGYEHFQL